jgi:hypothetical protein
MPNSCAPIQRAADAHEEGGARHLLRDAVVAAVGEDRAHAADQRVEREGGPCGVMLVNRGHAANLATRR